MYSFRWFNRAQLSKVVTRSVYAQISNLIMHFDSITSALVISCAPLACLASSGFLNSCDDIQVGMNTLSRLNVNQRIQTCLVGLLGLALNFVSQTRMVLWYHVVCTWAFWGCLRRPFWIIANIELIQRRFWKFVQRMPTLLSWNIFCDSGGPMHTIIWIVMVWLLGLRVYNLVSIANHFPQLRAARVCRHESTLIGDLHGSQMILSQTIMII